MKYKIIFLITSAILLFAACEDMHEKTEKYYGEIVYPAKYDTIYGRIGFERVEIDLLRAGRIPSNDIRMGKAQKTVIRYDQEEITLDQLVSWINIPGLTQSKIYRFFVYTHDEFGNESVPQEIALIPYTQSDLEANVINSPRITYSPSSAIIEWPGGLNSVLLKCLGFTYEYTDRDGNLVTGERTADASRFFVGNLETGKSYTLKMKYRIIPIADNIQILDTLTLTKDLTINIPASTGTFAPTEREILIKNGLTTFNYESAARFRKLTFPLETNSLQDVFYFANIEELDLTGGDLFDARTLTYSANSLTSTVGGGKIPLCISNVNDISDTQVIKDLLEAGTLRKIRYIPNSMRGLDPILAPYIAGGVVELVHTPDEVLIPNNYIIDGRLQSAAFEMTYTYNPANAPTGEGLQNIYQVIPKRASASFVIALPTEYRFNSEDYSYLKFKIHMPPKSVFTGTDANFQKYWCRFMNRLWNFGSHTTYGQELWNGDKITIPDADLQKWIDITVDISQMKGKHNRVIILNLGGEPGTNPTKDMTFYFSNIRLAKER